MSVTRMFGASVKRREDPRLISGEGTFTDDFKLPGMLQMAILRSPYAHARITQARYCEGEGACRRASPSSPAKTSRARSSRCPAPGCPRLRPQGPPYTALATDIVRFVGDAVAIVVADDATSPHDALDLIEVEYEAAARRHQPGRRRSSRGAPQALRRCAPTIRRSTGSSPMATPTARCRAPRSSLKQRIIQQRLMPNAMEPRSAVGAVEPGRRRADALQHDPEPAHRALPDLPSRRASPRTRCASSPARWAAASAARFPTIPATCWRSSPRAKPGRPVQVDRDRRENYVGDDPRPRPDHGCGDGRDDATARSPACASRTTPTWARTLDWRRRACRPGSSR